MQVEQGDQVDVVAADLAGDAEPIGACDGVGGQLPDRCLGQLGGQFSDGLHDALAGDLAYLQELAHAVGSVGRFSRVCISPNRRKSGVSSSACATATTMAVIRSRGDPAFGPGSDIAASHRSKLRSMTAAMSDAACSNPSKKQRHQKLASGAPQPSCDHCSLTDPDPPGRNAGHR